MIHISHQQEAIPQPKEFSPFCGSLKDAISVLITTTEIPGKVEEFFCGNQRI